MGQESYHFLMFDKRNQAIVAPDEYGDNILDIVGGFVVGNAFLETAEIISSIPNVGTYTPLDLHRYQSTRCYYTLDDGSCIIELEMNCGELAEQVEEISIRFAVSNPIETYEKTIGLCKLLCEKLNVDVYDMQLKQTLDFLNEIQKKQTQNSFLEKRRQFISDDTISVPLHCGKAFWDWIRDQNKS
ncbi:hypothetical protein [Paenibacillus phytohabitans]|uniref:hypothetical protein n=1 Tax=Paenibacillus phytohabitans TaxID=2654978 RepID=UPI00300A81B2